MTNLQQRAKVLVPFLHVPDGGEEESATSFLQVLGSNSIRSLPSRSFRRRPRGNFHPLDSDLKGIVRQISRSSNILKVDIVLVPVFVFTHKKFVE